MKKNLYILIFVLLFCAAVGLVWYWPGAREETIADVTNTTLYTTLTTSNVAFTEADAARMDGDFAQALPKYQLALQVSRDPIEKAQIRYFIAYATGRTQGYMAAIPLFKEIVADESSPPRIRAHTIQEMGSLFFSYGDPKITQEIFKDEPYASLIVTGDTSMTYRHLFEYASSFYPLALSELRIAYWYASNLSASATTASYAALVKQKVESADRDIARMQTDPLDKDLFPLALARRALVIGMLNSKGDMTFGDARAAYRVADAAYKAGGWVNGFVPYNEAVFLARMYGAAEASEIQTILSPIYTQSSKPGYAPILTFLKNGRATSSGNTSDIRLLASIDPKFKTFLLTLGWQDSDFK